MFQPEDEEADGQRRHHADHQAVDDPHEDLLEEDSAARLRIHLSHGDSPHDMFFHVPGVFEIPVTISKLINKYDAFVALGCVIKGETPHFDLISKAVVNGIMDLSVKSKKPIGNGIITCLNMKQAIERANPDKKNKGGEAVKAVLSTLANF